MKYFRLSIIFTIFGVGLGYALGYYFTGSVTEAMYTSFLVLVLGILETSLSFDNAVVNATVLEDMNAKWRKRFLTWGILIAVFGMRLILPLFIVSCSTAVSPWHALHLAISQPDEYEKIIKAAEPIILSFGGTFLLLIGAKYFIDKEKDTHWIRWIEEPLSKMGGKHALEYPICWIVVLLFSLGINAPNVWFAYILSAIGATIAYYGIKSLDSFMEEAGENFEKKIKAGFALFIYLEVLDASFSFDGVIGSFALSSNIFIIAIGLGIGAMFVRSMTLMLVEKKTLKEYTYLEHGAFYAIVTLALMMFIQQYVKIPEVVTGLTGAGFIGAALISSIVKNKRELKGSNS